MILTPGTAAPDFTLPEAPGQMITLSKISSPVVLIFYPADWSPVCGDELSIFQAAGPLFEAHGAQLLGISVDGVWCHSAFKADRKLNFPLLADFNPRGETAKSYGVFRDDDGITERALFVLDQAHTITWSHLSPIGVNPGADGALRALEALS
ncbi:MAG TPA: redoxin domain-containing protein [Acidimicrobiales bacterium]